MSRMGVAYGWLNIFISSFLAKGNKMKHYNKIYPRYIHIHVYAIRMPDYSWTCVQPPSIVYVHEYIWAVSFRLFSDIHVFWCAILIAHQIVMAKHGGSCVHFQESPLAGEPRDRLFHIHSVHRYQLCAKYLYPSTLLWLLQPLTTTWYDSLVLYISLLKI